MTVNTYGAVAETQGMLDFRAEHGVVANIEMIRMDQIGGGYDRMQRSDGKHRFVIGNAAREG